MDLKKKFLVCGGDLRQVKLADNVAKCGYKVKAFGFNNKIKFDENIKIINSIKEALLNIDIIVLPLPCSCNDEHINMPMYDEKLSIVELFKNIKPHQIVVAGKVSDKVKKLSELYNIVLIDYFEREELNILNVIPTVEGAIQIAMEELPITLHGTNCLILGFGRIGKLLAKSLDGLGVNVIVEARKFSDLAWIKAYGYDGVSLSDINQYIPKCDIIINTIPYIVLNNELLALVKDDALIIDLASKPGGVDFDAASTLGKKVIWALSLPGTVAPVTAGIIIKDTIFNLLEELGV